MTTDIIPTGSQLLVKAIEEESVPGELIVPDLAKKDKHTGKVVAVGLDAPDSDGLNVVRGDTIIYRTHATTEIEVDGEKYLVMPVEGVLVILR